MNGSFFIIVFAIVVLGLLAIKDMKRTQQPYDLEKAQRDGCTIVIKMDGKPFDNTSPKAAAKQEISCPSK